ncbi:MAG: helix-hairpin-helix domain-containing protein [Candidatus Thorarchaeota archaeon]
MSRKKKSRKKETVQATLGELVEGKSTETKKERGKKSTSKKISRPKKRSPRPTTRKKTVKAKRTPSAKPKKKTPTPVKEETGPPLSTLPGIGKRLQQRLIAAGYGSVDRISRSRAKSLSKKVDGVSLAGARKLVAAAKESVKRAAIPETIVEKESVPADIIVEETPASRLRLTDLPGVGAKLARELERSGYNTVARISRSRPSSVARVVDGLSLKKATVLVDSAIDLVHEAEIQSISGVTQPRPKPKDVPPKKAKVIRVKPEPKEPTPEEVKVVPAKKKVRKPKKPKKKVEKPPQKVVKKRPKPKRTKSRLPVPPAVEKLAKDMKKKWAAAEKRQAAIKAGELPEEEIAPLKETVEVIGMTADETTASLVEVAMEVLNEAMTTGRPAFEIPSRSGDNIVWDEIRDLLLLGMKTVSRPYHSLASVVDATRTARVMEIVYQLLKSNLHATKREVFYSDVNLFREQKRSDKIVEDVASMLHTTRDSVHIVASARGSAMGRVVIRDGGDTIDLTRMGTGGWAITPFLDQVEILESDAEFIIMSEKDAAVMRLAEAKYWNRQPCIVLTGKGSGDIATRAFLRMLVKELEIPAFALVDSDPYGHYIYSVFLRGSKRLSYESPFIATPELKLLGVLSRDLDEYDIPKSVRIPMEPTDIKRVKDMLKEPFVKANRDWVKDLQLMLKLKEKAEIQAFASHSFEYLTDDYLPRKLETGDWI